MTKHRQQSSKDPSLDAACSEFLDERPDVLAIAVVYRGGTQVVAPGWFAPANDFAEHVAKWDPSDI